MFPIVLTAGILLLGVLALAGRPRRPHVDGGPSDVAGRRVDDDTDLPCPWCLAPTREYDRRCPSCGQRFG